MTSNEKRQRATQDISEARKLQDLADSEKRELTSEESVNYDKYLEDALKLKDEADKMDGQRKALADAEARSAAVEPLISDNDLPTKRTDDLTVEQRAEVFKAVDTAFDDVMFYRGFNGPTIQARQNYETRALQADVDIEGGYTVAPPQFMNRLIQDIDELFFLPELATTTMVTTSDELTGMSLDTDPADPTWTAEIGSIARDSSMRFGARHLKPNQLAQEILVSRKLFMVSAINIEPLVRERMAYKLAVVLENAYMTGSGAGQPLGLMTVSDDGVTSSQDVDAGNTTTSITFDGLFECKYSLKAQYWPNASWIFHRDAVKQLAKLKDGEGQYQWESSLVGGTPDRLLNFPIRVSEFQNNTFTTGLRVGILGDYSHYHIAMLNSMAIQRLDELYAKTSQIGFHLHSWSDGMPLKAEAFRRVKLG